MGPTQKEGDQLGGSTITEARDGGGLQGGSNESDEKRLKFQVK